MNEYLSEHYQPEMGTDGCWFGPDASMRLTMPTNDILDTAEDAAARYFEETGIMPYGVIVDTRYPILDLGYFTFPTEIVP